MSYRDLEDRANRLATRLLSWKARPEAPVGVLLPRSPEMVIATLAVMKTGAPYIPLDPAYPAERLAFMLENSGARIVLGRAEHLPCACRWIDVSSPDSFVSPEHAPQIEIQPSDLAYIIYTSGSTGTPKGVEITHGGLSNLVSWHRTAFRVTAGDHASHLAGLGFDASVWELWPPLASGATIHLCDEITRTSAELLRDWLISEGITIAFVPSPIADRMFTLQWPPKALLRVLLTGGDTLHRHPPADLPFEVVNNYGPTECTVVATSTNLSGMSRTGALPPIGVPIANTRVVLLDPQLEPVADGETGEIHIGGAGLARGYRNQPDSTRERFIPDQFHPGERLYRTGDLGRYLPDGQIAFAGRLDDQIKIRGYRVEPGEIVAALNTHPQIQDCVVVAHADICREKRLVAYLICSEANALTHSALREFLRLRLPEYMIPAAFVLTDSFPLTPNGKIDARALPAPDVSNTLCDPQDSAPASPIEQQVSAIVAGLLELPEINRDDNFFLLGGHSLLGAQLISRLREAFGVNLALRALLDAPTVAGLAAEVERESQSGDRESSGAGQARTITEPRPITKQ